MFMLLQDRVMINRLDSICQTVLKGKWPSARRSYDANAVASFYTTKLLDSSGAATEYSEPSAPPPAGAAVKEEHDQSTQMSKVKKHVREKEFTVKIKDVCLFLLPQDLIAIAVCSMLFLQMAACSYSYFLHILVFWYLDCFFLFDIQVIKLEYSTRGVIIKYVSLPILLKIVLLLIKMLS